MPHPRFLFVCDRKFAELPGDDPQQRRCDACKTDVHNLDAMTADRRAEFLARARVQASTVCVSVTVPAEVARSCGDGPDVPEPEMGRVAPVVLAGDVDVSSLFDPPPQRGDPDTTTRTFPADLPAVRAELEVMAPGFDLVPGHHGGWTGHEPAHALLIDVVLESAGKDTAVVVRHAPPGLGTTPPPMAPRQVFAMLALLVLLPLWLLLAFILWLAAAPVVWLLVGASSVVGLLAAIVGGFLAVNAYGERARRQARDRWVAAWNDRFWPALTARLGERPPYR